MFASRYRESGTKMIKAFGVEYPREFNDRRSEYDALLTSVGIIDLTHLRCFDVTGDDRSAFLNAMLTSDIAALDPGDARRTLMTTPKGKIISELLVLSRNDGHRVVVLQGDAAETLDAFEKHIVSEDVVIADVSESLGTFAVEGPRAGAVIDLVFGKGHFPDSADQWVGRDFTDAEVMLANVTATGEPGYHVIVPEAHAATIRDYLVQAARGQNGMPVGHDAWEIRRAENGLPWYGVDFSGDNFPQEARLGHLVSYTKGCFRGQETLSRIRHRGHVNRLLVGLVLADNHSPGVSGELPAARPTSVVLSYRLEQILTLAYVPAKTGDPGNEVALELENGVARMRIVDLPLPPKESMNR
jgi:aminomethyltransferase